MSFDEITQESKMTLGKFAALMTLVLAIGSAVANLIENMEIEANSPKYGQFTNCGKVPFSLLWSPYKISPTKPLKFIYNYTTPHIINEGTYHVAVAFHGESYPFFEMSDKFACKDIEQFINCPVKKDMIVAGSRVFEHIENVGSYPGIYDATVQVKTKLGEELICAKATITIEKE